MSSDSNEAPHRLRVGKYEVRSHIATGGMGAVYKALDSVLKREVALKVMNPELARNPGMMERFRREAQAAARLHHENIISVYEFGEERGTYYMAMEFVDGDDLHSIIDKKGKLPPDVACEFLRQALHALAHAHQQGIVHRDIKPSNFLIVRKHGKMLVKLGDMGLARQQKDEDFRLTRAGTTVGTIDYMAPEQAKDSDAADSRSDIYSLGCTLFHVLTGRAPFPEGSMVERMYKHLEARPPDIRQLNDAVPPGLAYVLGKMLAKKPEQRYQKVEEVLVDLKRMDKLGAPTAPSVDVLSGLLEGMPLSADTDRPRLNKGRAAAPSRHQNKATLSRADDSEDGEDDRTPAPARIPPAEPPPRRRLTPYIVIGFVAAAVVAAGIVALNVFSKKSRDQSAAANSSSGSVRANGDDSSSNASGSSATGVGFRPHPGGIVWMSQAIANMTDDDVRSLKKDINKPWESDAGLPGTPTVISVSRKHADLNAQQQNTVTAAVALVRGSDSRIIEIGDNGPIYEPALEFNDGANVSIRGAAGYRPLLVWDLKGPVAAFIKLSRGSLILENLDIVIRLSQNAPEAALVGLVDSDLDVKGCSFSVVGASRNGFAAVRFETTSNHRCRFSNCVVRGSHMSALDIEGSAADILFDNCVLAGNERPLIRVSAPAEIGITLRIVRSTAIAGDNLLELRAQSANDSPALQFIAWDSALARSRTPPGGAMVRVADNKPSNGLEWRAVNCIYAGWKNLLEAKVVIAADDWATWVQRFQNADNDRADAESWPPAFGGDLGMRPAGDFQVRPDMPVAYFRTREPKKGSKDQPNLNVTLGCDTAALPVLRDGWYTLAYDRGSIEHDKLVPERFDGSALDKAPDGAGNPYAGETFNPATAKEKDLGAHLENIKKNSRLADKIVIRLQGAGEWPTSPIRLKGTSLVLYFDPGDGKDTRPFVFEPKGKSSAQEELIAVQGGDLDIVGVEFRMPRKDFIPAHTIHVTRGNLRMHHCKLYGPQPQHPPEHHKSLIRVDKRTADYPDFASSGPPADKICVFDECVFVTTGTVAELSDYNLHVRMQGCLAVAGQELLKLDFSSIIEPHLNIHYWLEQNTIAARGAVLQIEDSKHFEVPLEPAILAARGNVFWSPFVDVNPVRPSRSGLLWCQPDTLVHGTFLWYGEDNVYDKRLHFVFSTPDNVPKTAQPMEFWRFLWSCDKDILQVYEGKPPPQVDFANPRSIENLQLPAEATTRDPPPGADFVKLGLKKPKGS